MSRAIDPVPNAKPGFKPPAGPSPTPRVPLAKSPVVPVRNGDSRPNADEEEDGGFVDASAIRRQAPAWAVSMLVHIVLLLLLALIYSKPDEKPKPREIVSFGPESQEPLEEFKDDSPPNPEKEETTTEVVTAEVVIPDVVVASDASDLDAAPLALEVTDFADTTAPASDLLSTIGAAGGKSVSGFGGRKNPGQAAAGGGGGADTEEAVDRALKWLADHQLPDGNWTFDLNRCPGCEGKCKHGGVYPDDGGATALALLPFLGRGYTHKEGPYQAKVAKALKVLATRSLENNGMVYNLKPAAGATEQTRPMYVQGLAGIALSEAYGMTQDEQLRLPAQYALNFIMDAQDPVGGGWRYMPKEPGDTSAVGWQIMALKSGHMAYLEVKPSTIKKASEFLDSMASNSGALYGYSTPLREGASLQHSAGTTSVGLLCRMYLGWKKDHPALQRGVMELANKGPTHDLYYCYYATQVMHHMEGDVWTAWNNKMKPFLLAHQSKEGHEAGSWHDGTNGGHGHQVGRVYCTALATLILEVYYRHAPLYRGQAVDEQFRE